MQQQSHREPRAFTRVKKALGASNLKNNYSRPTSFSHLHEPNHQIIPNQLDVTKHTVTFPESKPFDIPSNISRSMQSSDDNYIEKVRGKIK